MNVIVTCEPIRMHHAYKNTKVTVCQIKRECDDLY